MNLTTRIKKVEKDLGIGELPWRVIVVKPEGNETPEGAYQRELEKIKMVEPDFRPENFFIVKICLNYKGKNEKRTKNFSARANAASLPKKTQGSYDYN